MGLLKKIFGKNNQALAKGDDKKEFSIYLLDDDEFLRKKTELYYNSFGENKPFHGKDISIHVDTYADSMSLQQAIDKKAPTLLILDYYLGADDNFSSGNQFREQLIKNHPNLRIAILSSMQDGSKVLSLIKRGLRDYVIKDEDMFNNLDDIILSMI